MVAGRHLSPAADAEIMARIARLQPIKAIVRELGVERGAVRLRVRRWIAANPDARCPCGQAPYHTHVTKDCPAAGSGGGQPITPRQAAQIRRLAKKRLSGREIGRRVGVAHHTASRYAAPILEEFRRQGVTCECGQRLGHTGPCPARPTIGPRVIDPDLMLRLIRALVNGEQIGNIQKLSDVKYMRLLRLRNQLPPEELAKRRAAMEERRLTEDACITSRIEAAVPKSLERHLRDEVVQEVWLAIRQGEITLDEIEAETRRYIGRAFAKWANRYGPRSLDAMLFEDGDGTLLDFIGDETALERADAITIGERSGPRRASAACGRGNGQ